MAHYPEIETGQADKVFQALLYQMIFETPEQKRDRIEREKVYELQRLNDNLENQQRFTTYPYLYSTWKSTPVNKWKTDTLSLCLVMIAVLAFCAFAALILTYFIGGFQC